MSATSNALAESFVDSFKTELIADRVWRTRTQLELAVVEYVGWFNNARLHESLGDIPPVEYEQHWREGTAAARANPDSQSVEALAARAADGLTTRRLLDVGTETVAHGADQRSPAPSTIFVDAARGPENASLNAGPVAVSLRSPSGLAPRNGDGRHEPEGATTLTIKSTETN